MLCLLGAGRNRLGSSARTIRYTAAAVARFFGTSPPTTMSASRTTTKTVVVLGVAYGGGHVAKMLAASLPPDWRVVAIDRNSHMNHVYVFPRFVVKPELAPKAYIPYKAVFEPVVRDADKKKEDYGKDTAADAAVPPTPPKTPPPPSKHSMLQGLVTRLERNRVTYVRPNAAGSYGADDSEKPPADRTETLEFDYAVYALGASLPAPVDVWGTGGASRGTKAGGMAWMEKTGGVMGEAERVLVVGGGALGIQYATDLKDVYPDKEVTLLHSRKRLLPIYPEGVHDAVVSRLDALGIRAVLGERVLEWPENPGTLDGVEKVVKTDAGNTYAADLVLVCTGPKAHVGLMRALDERAISPVTGRIRVSPTTQVSLAPVAPFEPAPAADAADADAAEALAKLALDTPTIPNIFAIGDCAQTAAIQAGHTSYYQGEVAARNIIRLIKGEADELEDYAPGVPAIKVTLGLKHWVMANTDGVTSGDDGVEHLLARYMWPLFGADDCPDHE
ncbi:Fe-regulated protein 8 [Vanrija pseudolonga]|uniref:Fe-regulated protein 8 n=1 Tax=Vanrija pseudolonga TaxID=143232 RepID=A0AAF0XZM2_9TREE|nr:Fe-regulated protein 8 [Vanrija pseudolonga]